MKKFTLSAAAILALGCSSSLFAGNPAYTVVNEPHVLPAPQPQVIVEQQPVKQVIVQQPVVEKKIIIQKPITIIKKVPVYYKSSCGGYSTYQPNYYTPTYHYTTPSYGYGYSNYSGGCGGY